jgi:hypothetical protein
LHIHSFDIGIDGENIAISYYELRELLKTQRPKIVVLETFSLELTDLMLPGMIFRFTDSGPLDFNRLAVAYRFLNFDNLYTIFPSLRTRVDWNSPAPFFRNLEQSVKGVPATTNPKFGYSGFNYAIQEEVYLTAWLQPPAKNNYSLDQNKAYLDKFVKLCEQNNIQLFLATTPIIKISGGQFHYYQPFDVTTYAAQNGLEVLPFDASNLNHLHYGNLSHLNSFGSVNYSIDLASALAHLTDLHDDQKKLEYYNTFRFTDYSLTHDGNHYVLDLIPADKQAPLQYQFSIINVETGKPLVNLDPQSQSEYVFDLPKKGNFDIEVKISNPDGPYGFTGDFRINLNL